MKLAMNLAFLALAAVLAEGAKFAAEEESDIATDYDHLKRSIVRIQTVHPNFDWFRPFTNSDGSVALGSGFFVQTEPYLLIATNQHVINDALNVKVQLLLHGETQWDVDIVSASPKFDLALLTLKDDKGFKEVLQQAGISPTALSLSKNVASMGQDVIAMGFPLGQNSLKISKGNVAGNEVVSRNLCIQSTAPISPGNSGGPLLDEMGTEVVGVNFAGATSGENINFVIPAWRVQAMINLHRLSQPHAPSKNQSWKRLGFTTPEHGLLTVQPSQALYKASHGCHEGVYVGRVQPDGFVSKAKPAVVEGSMLVSVAGKKVDKFGKAAIPDLMEGKASIDDLFFISPNLLEEVSFQTCLKGKITTHKVKTAMTPDYEKGIPYIDEPITRKVNSKFEMFGDIGVMSMTVNHISAAYQKTHAPQITRWLLPERVTKPRLMIVYVRPGTYASEVIPEGAAVEKVNGKVVRTLEDWQGALTLATKEDIFTLQTDLGVLLAVPYKETLRNQLKQSSLQPFVLTEGVKQAAVKLGYMEEVEDEEEDDEDVTEKVAHADATEVNKNVKEMMHEVQKKLEARLEEKMEKKTQLEKKLEKLQEDLEEKKAKEAVDKVEEEQPKSASAQTVPEEISSQKKLETKQLKQAMPARREPQEFSSKEELEKAMQKQDMDSDEDVDDDEDDDDAQVSTTDANTVPWHVQEYKRVYTSTEPSMADYSNVKKGEVKASKPVEKVHKDEKKATVEKVVAAETNKAEPKAFRTELSRESTKQAQSAQSSSIVNRIFNWFAAPDVHQTAVPAPSKPQAWGQHGRQATLLQQGEQAIHAAGPVKVISALSRPGLVVEGSAAAKADQLAAVMGNTHLPM
mmetsp:Transcript_104006/g.184685  ORF Transcript_104006/g.184685 Transcript_104006/m.184685 type:complete len:855 (+) Transcript_104006:43-2607(+)|eukprot:CAMPEP_0197656026 /NCGR_PEP_ID=MMETSP1338-20131121/39880_1 /TAXON_ID=43686 ORGANISM="Pelagodinium beii, Strain RCC1491" /NCGR_SAMPLE_ID=MMETSP1338 /ASSEMBLY_ACC=CAM_ASM_000754 /LENGTH=854 /DNA_ID=CAMNT_0043231815 /DNA_START=43 /DNA_END=2607 /DNA_ORIENTATION=+